METLAVLAGIAVAVCVAKLLFGLFFEDGADFMECVGFSLTPNVFSLFKGKYWEDQLKSAKLGLFLMLVIGSGAITFYGIRNLSDHSDSSSRLRNPQVAPQAEMPE